MITETYKATFIPVGGAEDKGTLGKGRPELHHDGILSHIVKESGGKGARIAVIPAASSIPDEVAENYIHGFGALGAKVDVVDIRHKKESSLRPNLDTLEAADCIFMTGGNQSKIITKMANTPVHDLLKAKAQEKGFVISGTSAGAMAMSYHMISGGSAADSLVKGAVQMKLGLGLLSGLIIDTHFVRRGRFGRLAEAVASRPELMGVGLGEDTGLIIRPDGTARVIGTGMVIVMDPAELSHNSHQDLQPGTPMSLCDLKMHILSNGDNLNIFNRKADALRLDQNFI